MNEAASTWLAPARSAAESAAEEAIALCRRTLRDTYETVAHGVLARALLRRDQSLEIARRQEAKAFELRAGTSLARLRQAGGVN